MEYLSQLPEEIRDIAFENSPNSWVSERMIFIPMAKTDHAWAIDIEAPAENEHKSWGLELQAEPHNTG